MRSIYTLDENNEPIIAPENVKIPQAVVLIKDVLSDNSYLVTRFLGYGSIPAEYDTKRKNLTPLLFETFLKTPNRRRIRLERYRSWNEALNGHKNHVKELLKL